MKELYNGKTYEELSEDEIINMPFQDYQRVVLTECEKNIQTLRTTVNSHIQYLKDTGQHDYQDNSNVIPFRKITR